MNNLNNCSLSDSSLCCHSDSIHLVVYVLLQGHFKPFTCTEGHLVGFVVNAAPMCVEGKCLPPQVTISEEDLHVLSGIIIGTMYVAIGTMYATFLDLPLSPTEAAVRSAF